MRVFDDPWYRGIMLDGVFAGPFSFKAADLVYHGRGTKYERQRYTFEEYRWACHRLGKPCERTVAAMRE